jgi:hypothetical protein
VSKKPPTCRRRRNVSLPLADNHFAWRERGGRNTMGPLTGVVSLSWPSLAELRSYMVSDRLRQSFCECRPPSRLRVVRVCTPFHCKVYNCHWVRRTGRFS